MTVNELRELYLSYYKERGHKITAAASLVPEEKDKRVDVEGSGNVLRSIKRNQELVQLVNLKGATGIFDSKYDNQVKVYSIKDYSLEIWGGPHANNTAELGRFKIIKEQSSSAGVRRIKAIIG